MAYLYRHIRLDKNEVFYVGIGSDDLGKYIRAFKKDRSKHWKNIVNQTKYYVEIMLDDLSWEEACEKEKEFIQLYGRRDLGKGTLINLTNGGEGVVGVVMSSETKNKISKKQLGKKISDEAKKKMSLSRKGKKFSDSAKKNMSIARKGKKGIGLGKITSNDTKLKISLALKCKKKSKIHIENMKKSLKGRVSPNKGKKMSNDTKLKISKTLKGRKGFIHSEETKIKISNSKKGKVSHRKGKKLTEEHKRKISESHKKFHNNK